MRKLFAFTLLFSMFLGMLAPAISAAERPYEGVELIFLRHSGYDADWMASKTESFTKKLAFG